jgi:hypothetical protein
MRPTENERRAAVVAALRELADLLESDETLPVPQWGQLQACVALGRPQGERFAAVRAFAQHLGVDVVEHGSGSRAAGKFFGPIRYFTHANADEPPELGGERVVPASEDARLLAADRSVAA